MPRYEFRCRKDCGLGRGVRRRRSRITRPMSASGEPATCPLGHHDIVRLPLHSGRDQRWSRPVRTFGARAADAAAGGAGCG